MSVKVLKIITETDIIQLDYYKENKSQPFVLTANGQSTFLDRNAADMIYLFLQEHLKL